MTLIPTNYIAEGFKLTKCGHKFNTEIETLLFCLCCFPSNYKTGYNEQEKVYIVCMKN
jgi:hypothetical protein